MKLQEKVGQRIAFLRKEKKLSQLDFSYEANLERTYLTHIENGRKNISMVTLEKIISALGVTQEKFFSSDEFKNKGY